MKHSYTYQIKEIDIVSGHFLVKYTPLNTELLSKEYNLPGYLIKDNDSPMTVEEIIEAGAPHDLWSAQQSLLAQYTALQNKTGTINHS